MSAQSLAFLQAAATLEAGDRGSCAPARYVETAEYYAARVVALHDAVVKAMRTPPPSAHGGECEAT